MGRLRFEGHDAAALLDSLLTRKVLGVGLGKVRYSLMTNEAGGILDDVLVYHIPALAGQPYHGLVVNASNRAKIVAWIEEHRGRFPNVQITDRTEATAMIAVQGPRAIEVVDKLVDLPIDTLGYYTCTEAKICGHAGILSRTGYTGEDGCEVVIPASAGAEVWEKIMSAGAPLGARAVGLGARDTLRLEAAMPLYGHELSEQINPYQAGLGFAVNLEGREFMGRAALAKLKDDANQLRRVGLSIDSRRVPREHYPVLADGKAVGEVTSGTYSPTLNQPIAMAYVPPAYSAVGTDLAIDVRGKPEPARVVPLPFYKRA
jgi:aminomethyltransferase